MKELWAYRTVGILALVVGLFEKSEVIVSWFDFIGRLIFLVAGSTAVFWLLKYGVVGIAKDGIKRMKKGWRGEVIKE